VTLAPERRLAALLALAAPLWLFPGRVGIAVGAVAVVAIVVAAALDAVLLPPIGALHLSREAPPSVGIGDSVHGALVLESRWPRALRVEVADAVPPNVSGGVHRALGDLAPFGTLRVPFTLRGERRARAPLGAAGVHVRTWLGLVGARYASPLADEILVVPSIAGVSRYRLLALQHRLDAAGMRALRQRGEGNVFTGLREYAAGDDPRLIDWKATARRARLISREVVPERSQTVLTVIDAGRGMTQLAGEHSRFEQALSSALVLTEVATSSGDRVGTMVFDDEILAFVPPRASHGALRTVRDAFIPLAAATREPDYAQAFRFLAAHQRKRALIVVYTDVIDPRASQALVAHVARRAVRHLVLVVALRNDGIFAAAQPHGAGNLALLYESAAAEELIHAREQALQQMRRAGVIVLDVSPAVMTASVVNRYLEIKRRGAL
jgi:uncharacterized protein (DUF58 family)